MPGRSLPVRALFASLACALVCAAATGCGSTRRTDDRLVVAVESEPASLDPALSKDVPSGRLVALLYSTLVRFDRELRIEGDLADSFLVQPDGRTYTFHIRPDATFASGRSVTAQDVKYSLERVLDPKTASARTWVLDRIEGAREFMAGRVPYVSGIEARGASVVIRLAKPFAPFLGFLTMPAASVVDPDVVKKWGPDFPRHESGSGPWTVASWVKDTGLELVPNRRYHRGPPRARGLVVRVIREPVTLMTEMRLGNVDIAGVPPSEFSSVRADARWTACLADRPGLNIYFLGLNCEKGPFADARLRRAAAHAIDRERIVRTVRNGQAAVAAGPIPPGLFGHEPGFAGLRHDMARARALVAEASGKSGVAIRILQGDDKSNLEVTQMVAAYLEQAGFTPRLVSYEFNTFRKRVDDGDFDAFYLSWFADYADAENFLFPLFHSSRKGGGGNGPRFSDPEVDALLERAQGCADDRARRELYRTIEERVVGAASRVFLFHRKQIALRQPWVTGYELYPVFNSDRMHAVGLDAARLGQF
jgi:peptide/nickel transport system substrate-binding protein/oligopeptide transport system substrate-binding protein